MKYVTLIWSLSTLSLVQPALASSFQCTQLERSRWVYQVDIQEGDPQSKYPKSVVIVKYGERIESVFYATRDVQLNPEALVSEERTFYALDGSDDMVSLSFRDMNGQPRTEASLALAGENVATLDCTERAIEPPLDF